MRNYIIISVVITITLLSIICTCNEETEPQNVLSSTISSIEEYTFNEISTPPSSYPQLDKDISCKISMEVQFSSLPENEGGLDWHKKTFTSSLGLVEKTDNSIIWDFYSRTYEDGNQSKEKLSIGIDKVKSGSYSYKGNLDLEKSRERSDLILNLQLENGIYLSSLNNENGKFTININQTPNVGKYIWGKFEGEIYEKESDKKNYEEIYRKIRNGIFSCKVIQKNENDSSWNEFNTSLTKAKEIWTEWFEKLTKTDEETE